MHSQEVQLSVCDVFDHGRFRFENLAADVGLKELRPARLLGRTFPGLQRAALAKIATQLMKGYHDAPSITDNVCMAFCKMPVPLVRASADRRTSCATVMAAVQQCMSTATVGMVHRSASIGN
jgi:hypothetical protein